MIKQSNNFKLSFELRPGDRTQKLHMAFPFCCALLEKTLQIPSHPPSLCCLCLYVQFKMFENLQTTLLIFKYILYYLYL